MRSTLKILVWKFGSVNLLTFRFFLGVALFATTVIFGRNLQTHHIPEACDCHMDRPRPGNMILRVILSQLRRLTLTELLELMQAIIQEVNDRYVNGHIGGNYDPSGYTDGRPGRSWGNGPTRLICPDLAEKNFSSPCLQSQIGCVFFHLQRYKPLKKSIYKNTSYKNN